MSDFEFVPANLRPDPRADMLGGAAKFNFPTETSIHFYGVYHSVRGLPALTQQMEEMAAQSSVVAIETERVISAGSNVTDKKDIQRQLAQINAIAQGEVQPRKKVWTDMVAFHLGEAAVEISVDVPEIIFVDVHDKPENARRLQGRHEDFVINSASPAELFDYLKTQARLIQYRERTVVSQLSHDSRQRPASERAYSLIMGANHNLIVEMLRRTGVSVTEHPTDLPSNDWESTVINLIRQGYPFTVDDMPQSDSDLHKIEVQTSICLALATSSIRLSESDDLRLQQGLAGLDDNKLRVARMKSTKMVLLAMLSEKAPVFNTALQSSARRRLGKLLSDFDITI